ncbi:MAG: hypothetical protein MGU50_10875 [Trichodesmium sp. MAG_R02]|nr:hypothetical protein [Trichodesmium sp. MAG_R02]
MSFFEYVRDIAAARLRQRISQAGNISPLASIIYDRSSINSLGWSWQV